MNKRNPYWDNLKLILIFLVVLGHFIIPVADSDRLTSSILYFIYLFHMPAFVFVSGHFSKSHIYKANKEYKLIGFLALYVVSTMSISLVELIFTQKTNVLVFLKQGGAPWYMLALFFWYLLIPFASSLHPAFSLPSVFILALFVGAYPECGDFLSLSRTIVFFPFFLIGYYFDECLLKTIKPWMRIVSALILLSCFIFILNYPAILKNYQGIIYGAKSYKLLGLSNKIGIIIRTIWYLAAIIMTSCLICLVPYNRMKLTYIGERTLGIYLIHRIFRDIFIYLGVYDYFNRYVHPLVFCIIASIIMINISSSAYVAKALTYFFHLNYVMRNNARSKY